MLDASPIAMRQIAAQRWACQGVQRGLLRAPAQHQKHVVSCLMLKMHLYITSDVNTHLTQTLSTEEQAHVHVASKTRLVKIHQRYRHHYRNVPSAGTVGAHRPPSASNVFT